jgi:hypothetical protein
MNRYPSKASSHQHESISKREAALEEVKKWSETFEAVVQILTRVVPYPSTYITSPEEERSILLQLCRQITDSAQHPEEAPKYKELARRLEDAEIQISELNIKCEQLTSDVHRLTTKSYSPSGVKSGLTERLDRLQALLASQISEQRNGFGQSRAPRSHSHAPSPLSGRGNATRPPSPTYRNEFKNSSRANSPGKSKPKDITVRDRVNDLPFSKKSSTKPRKTGMKN